MKVPSRSSSETLQTKGIYLDAKVVRGPDWTEEYREQDGENMFSYNQTSSVTYSADGDD